jgi:hypothetical protein
VAARPGRGDSAGSRRWRHGLPAVARRRLGLALVREERVWARGMRQGERDARVGFLDLGFQD